MTRLDPRSMATALAHPVVPGPAARAVVLIAARDMVRGELAARDFVELAMQSLIGEEHSPTLKGAPRRDHHRRSALCHPRAPGRGPGGCTATLRDLAEGQSPAATPSISSSPRMPASRRARRMRHTCGSARRDRRARRARRRRRAALVLLRALAAMGRVDDATIEAEGRPTPRTAVRSGSPDPGRSPDGSRREQAWAEGSRQG